MKTELRISMSYSSDLALRIAICIFLNELDDGVRRSIWDENCQPVGCPQNTYGIARGAGGSRKR